jgi:hypothetical protein
MLDFARLRLTQVFATELDPLPEAARTDLLNALDAVTTWSAWHHWRGCGLDVEQARHTMAAAVHTLLAGAGAGSGATAETETGDGTGPAADTR